MGFYLTSLILHKDMDIDMNLSSLRNRIILGLCGLCLLSAVQAGIPVWSFSPIGSPVVSVSATGTAVVQYTVTNNSKKAHQLVLSAKTPAGISQLGAPCVLAAKSAANPTPSCTLTLSINGNGLPTNNLSGGPFLCQTNPNGTPNANQCYQPGANDALMITRTTVSGATTLSTSVSPPSILALSVNNAVLNSALTGNARQITITNTGDNDALGLTIAYPSWPGGTPVTSASSTCGSILTAGATCTITINPGSNATSNCDTGIAPTLGTITVSATNVATPVTSHVVVLSYGCQYQGGFLYSVDDTTNNGVTGTCTMPPCMNSIGGAVVSLTDQAAPFINSGAQASSTIWSSNGGGPLNAVVSYDVIPLISESTTVNDSYDNSQAAYNTTYSNVVVFPFPVASAFDTCNGAIDGQCNTGNILTFYDSVKTGYEQSSIPYILSAGPTNRADYAAGLCKATINSYSDWYLPSICEMDALSTNVTCPAQTQSMSGTLSFLIGNPVTTTPSTSCTPPSGTECLAGSYWSSTDYSGDPLVNAWVEHFISGGSSYQSLFAKFSLNGVRCSRALRD